MSDNPSLLKFTTSELTDVHTEIYQLDNGKANVSTVLSLYHLGFIFYFYNDWPEQQRLYVKWLWVAYIPLLRQKSDIEHKHR